MKNIIILRKRIVHLKENLLYEKNFLSHISDYMALNPTNRIQWLDVAKGLGIILMFIGHSPTVPHSLFKMIYSFHMPLFFIIAGYLWKTKYAGMLFIINKFKAYILPYFILSALNIILSIYNISDLSWHEIVQKIYDWTYWIVYSMGRSDKVPNCTPLWFLPCLFCSSLLMFFIIKFKEKYQSFYALTLFLVFIAYREMLPFKEFPLSIHLPWHFDTAFVGAFLMYIGYLISKKKIIENKYFKKLIIVLIPFSFLSAYKNTDVNLCGSVIGNPILFLFTAITISLAVMLLCKEIIKHNFVIENFCYSAYIAMGFNYFFNGLFVSIFGYLQGNRYFFVYDTIFVMLMCIVVYKIFNIFCKVLAR